MSAHKKLKDGEAFSVTTMSGLGFNRSGFRFSKDATLLTASQITKAILDEPMLRVEIVKVGAEKEEKKPDDPPKE